MDRKPILIITLERTMPEASAKSVLNVMQANAVNKDYHVFVILGKTNDETTFEVKGLEKDIDEIAFEELKAKVNGSIIQVEHKEEE